jgi:hypothetical protein
MSNQRWLARRDSYRPPTEPIRTALYDVAPIADDRTARTFVCEHHYSGTYPAARFRFGLYRLGELVGVAVVASAGGDGDVPAHPDSADLLCRQLVELEASAILDMYELEPADRERFVANFLHRLVNLPKSSWRPALVVVDEAHEFAPERGDVVATELLFPPQLSH